MCCLRYEHDFYAQARKRFPKEGKILVTARGEEKVLANDIFNDRVMLRGVEGDTRAVPLAELRRELDRLNGDATDDESTESDIGPAIEDAILLDDGDLALGGPQRTATPASAAVVVPGAIAPGSVPSTDDSRAPRRRGRRGGRRGKRGGERGTPPAGG
jgi:hypothetical protein